MRSGPTGEKQLSGSRAGTTKRPPIREKVTARMALQQPQA